MNQTPVYVIQGDSVAYVGGSQPQANIVYLQSTPVAAPPVDDVGRVGRHLNRTLVTVMGSLMVVCGVLAIIGGGLETAAYTTSSRLPSGWDGGYSESYYSGYWCGFLIVVAGAVATSSGRNVSRCMVIVGLIATGVGIVFAITLAALSIEQMATWIIDALELCWEFDSCGSFVALTITGYSVMIGSSGLTLIFGGVLVFSYVIALIRGVCR